jgi:hypothetical protein
MFGPGFDSLQLHLAGQLYIFKELSFFVFSKTLVCIEYYPYRLIYSGSSTIFFEAFEINSVRRKKGIAAML